MPTLDELFQARFGNSPSVPPELNVISPLLKLAGRGSCRAFTDTSVSMETIETLCGVALGAPSKSDLQQRDILIVENSEKVAALKKILGAQEWIANAPQLLIFLADNRRQRLMQSMHAQPFPNDHLDALFNASLDAGIALAFFIAAAESIGLGCCPISTIRNHLPDVARLFELPDHVFPVAALAVGHPAHDQPRVSPRLDFETTVHKDTFSETTESAIKAYDTRRMAAPVSTANAPAWSSAKAEMFAKSQREDFAKFVKSIGFKLD